MSLSIGIVGLPNAGKSTLFNALTRLQANAENYPFCTIEPNVGVVEVPDDRLNELAAVIHPAKVVPTTIEFVDIAGLVKNAHAGEGLGNQFLGHIRNVDAICHVVRVFADANVAHVEGSVDARRDVETIKLELALADLAVIERKLDTVSSQAKSGDKLLRRQLEILTRMKQVLEAGTWISEQTEFMSAEADEVTGQLKRELGLLTAKPVMYLVNLAEEEVAQFDAASYAQSLGLAADATVLAMCARVEEELNDLDREEANQYLASIGLSESSLIRVIRAGYELLDLLTFFTAGPKEVKAWTVENGSLAPTAAGVIHSDFEKQFIRAEIIPWDKLVEAGSYPAAREKGWQRTEGRTYRIEDGDVVHFLHSAH